MRSPCIRYWRLRLREAIDGNSGVNGKYDDSGQDEAAVFALMEYLMEDHGLSSQINAAKSRLPVNGQVEKWLAFVHIT
jgi:hypothetical protein